MPNFDLIAFAKFVARFAFIGGIVAFAIATSYTVYSMIRQIWIIFSSASSSLSGYLSGSGGGGSVLECVYYMFDALGINVVLTSFSVALFGLLFAYGGFVAHIVMFRFGLYLKTLALEVLK